MNVVYSYDSIYDNPCIVTSYFDGNIDGERKFELIYYIFKREEWELKCRVSKV